MPQRIHGNQRIDKRLMIKKTMGGFLFFGTAATVGYFALWYFGFHKPRKLRRMEMPRKL